MSIANTTATATDNVLSASLRRLLSTWPLYDPGHDVFAHEFDSHCWAIGYRGVCPADLPASQARAFDTHLDINIIDGTCYLLSIQIEPVQRGKGLGRQLYQIVEGFARETFCHTVEQTASGWTKSGERRADYLKRVFGYEIGPGGVARKVLVIK